MLSLQGCNIVATLRLINQKKASYITHNEIDPLQSRNDTATSFRPSINTTSVYIFTSMSLFYPNFLSGWDQFYDSIISRKKLIIINYSCHIQLWLVNLLWLMIYDSGSDGPLVTNATNSLKHFLIGQFVKFFLLIGQSNALKRLLLLCKATITNQILIDREGSSYYYLPLTPRVFTPTTLISGPGLHVDEIFSSTIFIPLLALSLPRCWTEKIVVVIV